MFDDAVAKNDGTGKLGYTGEYRYLNRDYIHMNFFGTQHIIN